MQALGLTAGAYRRVMEPAIAGQAVSAAMALRRQAPRTTGSTSS